MFILILFLIVFYLVEKFKDYQCNKKNLNSIYCIDNKCKLPVNSECSNNSNCKSNYCVNNLCKSKPECGIDNYQYNGNITNTTFTSKSFNCNKLCGKDSNCTNWNWNKYNKMCSLLSNATSNTYNNNIISGTKNSCDGNLMCTICYQFKDKCSNNPTNINICSGDNKRIINSSNNDTSQYTSYLNNVKPLKGLINCERSSIIKNTTLDKCREIANNQRNSGLNVVGYSVKYPSIKYTGWCGPDENIIKNDKIDNNVIYQYIQNRNTNGSVTTTNNPQGIRINTNKIINFENTKLITISNYPINTYSDKQRIIGTKYTNNNFYIMTSLNNSGIMIPKNNDVVFLNKSYIYISPSWYKNIKSKYPNCIYECLKNANCGAVRWVNSTKECQMLSKCSQSNTDNRWSHWIKPDQNNTNNSNRNNIWDLDGNGIPSNTPLKENKNISLELCQYQCKNNNNCNQISYSSQNGICRQYEKTNNTLTPNNSFTTFTFN